MTSVAIRRTFGRRPSTRRVSLAVLVVVVGFASLGCAGARADTANPKTSVLGAAPGAFAGLKASSVKLFDGSGSYREVRFTVTPPRKVGKGKAKKVFEGCAMLARNAVEHAQGMMQRTNFAGYDAMIFHFDEPSNGGFWMKTVPTDLSIAWVDAQGGVVGTAFMKREGACVDCPIYSPNAAFRTAVEVAPRGLARVGLDQVGDGAILQYGGRCTKSPLPV